MAYHLSQLIVLFILIIIVAGSKLSDGARVFTLVNECKETIWPGITHGEAFNASGFALKAGQSAIFTPPAGWGGRIWGRTSCNFDKNGNGTCQTGSCGTSLKCTSPGTPPASIADFTLGDIDYYDVSFVDGFNLPIVVAAVNGKGNCSTAGCDRDLRQNCSSELSVKSNGKTIACRSACDYFNTDEYCCRGVYGSPMTCMATNYSRSFKQVCPAAYSYAYDDPTSIVTCTGADYIVTFCATRNQTMCTYHDNKLTCNGSKALKAFSQRWWVSVLALSLMINIRTML
ncbi:hypothetical protein L1049_014439 [Liquidambar formosana]|uniref:Thaumatin-like protein n=1 Tax=Liquidambar formosana TaxID=63359 RepID=A0AAP0X5S1_LIQFO